MPAKRADAMFDADVRRITPVGWLAVLISAGIGLVCGYLVYANFDEIMERIGTGDRRDLGKGVPAIILIGVIAVSSALVFAMCKLLTQLLGLNVIHPRISDDPEPTVVRSVFREDM